MTYRYKLTKARGKHSKYGICDVCKKNVNDVYYQVEHKRYREVDNTIDWTTYKCRNLFGHRSCLIRKRRKGKKV